MSTNKILSLLVSVKVDTFKKSGILFYRYGALTRKFIGGVALYCSPEREKMNQKTESRAEMILEVLSTLLYDIWEWRESFSFKGVRISLSVGKIVLLLLAGVTTVLIVILLNVLFNIVSYVVTSTFFRAVAITVAILWVLRTLGWLKTVVTGILALFFFLSTLLITLPLFVGLEFMKGMGDFFIRRFHFFPSIVRSKLVTMMVEVHPHDLAPFVAIGLSVGCFLLALSLFKRL